MAVSVNPPKTPVTAGSKGVAAATIPNVCKMPGPPAPFVPTPLPNIGKSGDSPKGYSKKVKVEGKAVAIRGSSFKSMGDMASKGTGGGIVSSNTHGETKFIGPGSMDVKIESKNVQLLSDPMMNNCGPSGSPANSATLVGLVQPPDLAGESDADLQELAKECNKRVNDRMVKDGTLKKPPGKGECRKAGEHKHQCCQDAIEEYNKKNPKSKLRSEVSLNKAGKNPTAQQRAAAKKAADDAGADFCKQVNGKSKWTQAYDKAKADFKANGLSEAKAQKKARAAARSAYRGAKREASHAKGGEYIRPDVVRLIDPTKPAERGNIAETLDFKFNCKHTEKDRKSIERNPAKVLNKNQQDNYGPTTGTGGMPTVIFRPGSP